MPWERQSGFRCCSPMIKWSYFRPPLLTALPRTYRSYTAPLLPPSSPSPSHPQLRTAPNLRCSEPALLRTFTARLQSLHPLPLLLPPLTLPLHTPSSILPFYTPSSILPLYTLYTLQPLPLLPPPHVSSPPYIQVSNSNSNSYIYSLNAVTNSGV